MENQSQIYPFSLLSKSEQEEVTNTFSYEKFKKGTIILEHEITRLEKLYILSKGHAQYHFESHNTKILTGELVPGDNFGGLSLLFNDSISIRSLIVLEDSTFLTLRADFFSTICRKNPKFQDYFTNEFGRCMLKKTFASAPMP